ncbi:hypothetical protein [Legionella rowbothamii]|uniref:hypothetical protein n=1 Tax=Legionella rowbothamii TaxID=96229 RepID=UPI001056B03F|nr:hypothetical protein [Legionella rowbothamii]
MSKIAEFWDAFATKENDKLVKLIKENPELANEIQPTNKNSFLFRSLISKRPQELLECIVTSTALNFDYEQGVDKTTTRKVLIESAQTNLIGLVLDNPNFLFSKNELAYSLAIQAHKKFSDSYEERSKKDPNTPTALDHKEKRDNLATIIPILRKATIEYATQKKDDVLLERLADLEKSPSQPVGLNPNNLFAKNKKPKLTIEEIAEKELADLQKQLDKLRADHTKKQSQHYDEINKEREALYQEVQTITSKRH